MKKEILFLLTIFLVGGFLAADAEAGWFDKESEDEDSRAKSHRYDLMPSMSYHLGTLRRDSNSSWTLDEFSLQLMPGAQVLQDGEDSALREGKQAIIMGPRLGETIIAWRVRIMEPDWNVSRDTSLDHLITWSNVDSTVGEAEDPGPQ